MINPWTRLFSNRRSELSSSHRGGVVCAVLLISNPPNEVGLLFLPLGNVYVRRMNEKGRGFWQAG